MPVGLEESSSLQSDPFSEDEHASEDSPEQTLAKPLSNDELHETEDALLNFKSELAVMELEIQALVSLAEEISKAGVPEGSRKISGRYIQSHLHARLEESVQVMRSFDGWSQGEHLSPEYTGSFTKFSTTLLPRPGRSEIKFLVDGEWHLSPEYPTIGEGLMENNLLVAMIPGLKTCVC
ncbi:Protein PTST [Hibiscus syriacus]|uniref:Protein PTST n=1 Tax=Hibiscus syriacus TaxID=106335 RepID=A0A6A2YZI3_HIBSY|nr:Protein PTST [Hibiscus syriacus]